MVGELHPLAAQGTTGGIMDCGDGTLNGIFQFNRQFRRTEMCSTMTRAKALGCSRFGANLGGGMYPLLSHRIQK